MKTYGYVRVSTGEQRQSGLGLEAQRRIIGQVDEIFQDDISAYKNMLFDRPAGKRLLSKLLPGDTIAFARIDRIIRRTDDWLALVRKAELNGWNLVCYSPPINLKTATGKLFAAIGALVAEFESARRSERTKAALAQKGVAKKRERIASEPSDYRPRAKTIESSSGRVFVYARVSHRSSVESGRGLKDQLYTCCNYAADLAEKSNLKNGGEFVDSGVSAYSKNFQDRPSGLFKELRKGDHVVCANLDRMFRSLRDMSNTLYDLHSMGIIVHFVKEGVNTADSLGMAFISVIGAFADMEAQLISARNREFRAVLDSQGKYGGGGVPIFWKIEKRESGRILVRDKYQIATFRLAMLYARTMPVNDALFKLEQLLASRGGRKPIPLTGKHCRGNITYPLWTPSRYYKALEIWNEVQDQDSDCSSK